jgi:hypothetical protein
MSLANRERERMKFPLFASVLVRGLCKESLSLLLADFDGIIPVFLVVIE